MRSYEMTWHHKMCQTSGQICWHWTGFPHALSLRLGGLSGQPGGTFSVALCRSPIRIWHGFLWTHHSMSVYVSIFSTKKPKSLCNGKYWKDFWKILQADSQCKHLLMYIPWIHVHPLKKQHPSSACSGPTTGESTATSLSSCGVRIQGNLFLLYLCFTTDL